MCVETQAKQSSSVLVKDLAASHKQVSAYVVAVLTMYEEGEI